MSIQTHIADRLKAGMNGAAPKPPYIVRAYWWRPDGAEPGKTYVSVYRTTVEPRPDVAAGARQHNVQIVIMSTKTDEARTDADLDAALDAALDVIDTDDQLAGLVWQQAERGVISETYPAYTITGWVGTNQEQE